MKKKTKTRCEGWWSKKGPEFLGGPADGEKVPYNMLHQERPVIRLHQYRFCETCGHYHHEGSL